MKWHVALAVVLLLAFLTAWYVPNANAVSSVPFSFGNSNTNLILNGGFETGSVANAYNWTYNLAYTVKRVDVAPLNDTWSYQLNRTVSAVVYSDYFDISEGKTYYTSLWMKTNATLGTNNAFACLRIKNSTYEYTLKVITPLINGTFGSTWRRYIDSTTIPTGYGYNQSRISLNLAVTTSENTFAWYDDVQVSELSEVTIVTQPILIESSNLPKSVTLPLSIINGTKISAGLTTGDFTIYVGSNALSPSSVTYNATTGLWDAVVTIPVLAEGNYRVYATVSSSVISDSSQDYEVIKVYEATDTFTFVQVTDIHWREYQGTEQAQTPENVYEIFKLISYVKPDFVLNTGDFNGFHLSAYKNFTYVLNSLDFDIPMFFVSGNHEKDSSVYVDFSERWLTNYGLGTDHEAYYSFDFGDYHFIGLDSGQFPYDAQGDISTTQYNWATSDLNSHSSAQMIFAFYHHPLYIDGTNSWDNQTLATALRNLFNQSNVAAALQGHWHYNKENLINGTYYLTTASVSNPYWVSASYDASFRVIFVKDGVLESYNSLLTFRYQTNIQIFDITKTTGNLILDSDYGNYTNLPVNFALGTAPSLTLLETSIEKSTNTTLTYSSTTSTFTFTVTAPSGNTSEARIYCGSFGQPVDVVGETSWSYNSTTQYVTITATHSSPVTITVDWGDTAIGEYAYGGGTDLLLIYLLDGDLFGFFIGCYTSKVGMVFYGILILIVSGVFYNRTKSVVFLGIIWLLLGGTFIAVTWIFSPIAVILCALGFTGLIYGLYDKESS